MSQCLLPNYLLALQVPMDEMDGMVHRVRKVETLEPSYYD